MANNSTAVGLNYGSELRSVEVARSYPARELVIPYAIVATDNLVVALSQANDLLTASEIEIALCWLRGILYGTSANREESSCSPSYPFHAVTRCDLTKL